ncbi:MAG: tRNA uridine-5-carboxymethylaminomethyl(34) synthesis GTPase MnmE [Acidobacteriota bacterium]|nr:tRNA uridine-5-carboxymethylaminomethyl(34) synthesis GTPase MnmE [Acidobacteriota bacterium]
MHDTADTICAPSTPPGRSGIAVVRLCGPGTLPILQKVCARKAAAMPLAPRRATLCPLVRPVGGVGGDATSGETPGAFLDEALVTFFPASRSYTGEDIAEFSLHGNPVIVAALLETLCGLGARLAAPGEFTMRAFLGGRMDLAEAEAVHDIIAARTLYQAQVAARQRGGALARELRPVKDGLVEAVADLESAVEFAEEDLPTASRQATLDLLDGICRKINGHIDSFRRGRVVREGFSLALVGAPNAGKSSLFNALLGRERSIVTDMPGTTRDLVSEEAAIGGVPVRLEDTAGLRDQEGAGDDAERLGMERSRQAAIDADAVLLVVDAGRAPTAADRGLRDRLDALGVALGVVAFNKSDLPPCMTEEGKRRLAGAWRHLDVSAKTGAGVEGLRETILGQVMGGAGAGADGPLVTNLRHRQALERAQGHIRRGCEALAQGLSEEFALMDLRKALDALGEITGETGTEDLLDQIFSKFCVGK